MKIEYYHASKFGNGARVAEEFRRLMDHKGVMVNIHHVKDIKPKEIPAADLYIFSAPGRFGKPIGDMRRFLEKADLKPGTMGAVIVTELCPKAAGQEPDKYQRVLPIMNQILGEKGLTITAEDKVFVTGLRGPLEEGWHVKVEAFASRIPIITRAPDMAVSPSL